MKPKRKSRAAEAAAIIYRNRSKPAITLPPFHLKVPRERWPVFFAATSHYLGKMYVDYETIDFTSALGKQLVKSNRAFSRGEKSKRRAKRQPVTILLARESLIFFTTLYRRASEDAMAPQVPSWWDRFTMQDCRAFHEFAKALVSVFDRESKKSVVELLGEIPT